MEHRLGQHDFEIAMAEVDGYLIDRLPPHCVMWIDYRLEAGTHVAEKMFVDHEKRRLLHRAPIRRDLCILMVHGRMQNLMCGTVSILVDWSVLSADLCAHRIGVRGRILGVHY